MIRPIFSTEPINNLSFLPVDVAVFDVRLEDPVGVSKSKSI